MFRLSNSLFFLEKLIEVWDYSFRKQVPTTLKSSQGHDNINSWSTGTSSGLDPDTLKDCQALVLGNENFLAVITSCLVCVIKSDESLVGHLLAWGFLDDICVCLKDALDSERRGEPVTCAIRLLSMLVDHPLAVESLASAHTDAIAQIKRVLDCRPHSTTLPKESSFMVELVKKIFQRGKSLD
jgi:hypothetical protein